MQQPLRVRLSPHGCRAYTTAILDHWGQAGEGLPDHVAFLHAHQFSTHTHLSHDWVARALAAHRPERVPLGYADAQCREQVRGGARAGCTCGPGAPLRRAPPALPHLPRLQPLARTPPLLPTPTCALCMPCAEPDVEPAGSLVLRRLARSQGARPPAAPGPLLLRRSGWPRRPACSLLLRRRWMHCCLLAPGVPLPGPMADVPCWHLLRVL